MTWAYGDVIVHREIAWGRPWLAIPERVVVDSSELLVTFIATGAPFGFAPGSWPTANGHAHATWWGPAFTTWEPDPSWSTPELPAGWESVPWVSERS